MRPAPLLVLAVGNPSRGDDALGPLLLARAEAALALPIAAGEVELLTDFQLQIEHALDLVGRERAIFVDASVSAAAPYEVRAIGPSADRSHSTHALSPQAVLETYRRVVDERGPPPATLLAVRGESFELGAGLSVAATLHLEAALAWLLAQAGVPEAGLRLTLRGTVQGVGMRPALHRTARALGLRGRVRNTPGGVEIEVAGSEGALAALRRHLETSPPPQARIESIAVEPLPEAARAALPATFEIAPSAPAGGPVRLSMPPDLGVCAACLADVADPQSRFFGYPFTSCPDCGPRYSIARAAPFDRERTSMDAFPLCAACAAEYAGTGPVPTRRLHAQTLCCPACGPRIWLVPEGPAAQGQPLADAVARLRAGEILAVQGLGGFHLMCDATSEAAVGRLRQRKHREAKPFAVLVATLAEAEALAALDAAGREALCGAARPVVLAPPGPGASALAPAVRGDSARVGVALPALPLSALLAQGVGRPLVLTSGNRSGAPLCRTHAEAFAELADGVADALLLHDREIVHRAEDSVVQMAAGSGEGGVQVLRRARGLAPCPVRLAEAAPMPILATGGHQKAAACLLLGDEAWLTPHLGDLDTEEALAAYDAEVAAFEALLGTPAWALAHDAHPDYATTRWAAGRGAAHGLAVQHHRAHALAAGAALGLRGPFLALALDGTGAGEDGTSWGCELLHCEGASARRLTTMRALPLPGGELAIREIWRAAAGALQVAYGPEAAALAARMPVFADVDPRACATVWRLLATGAAVTPVHGLGRLFDALSALLLDRPRAAYEADAAMRLESAAWADAEGPAPPWPAAFAPRAAGPDAHLEWDFAPLVRAVVEARLELGPSPAPAGLARAAARLHTTLAAGLSTAVEAARATTGCREVVLTGGCLQSRHLARALREALPGARLPLDIPVNDGGLALGQAVAAASALRPAPICGN